MRTRVNYILFLVIGGVMRARALSTSQAVYLDFLRAAAALVVLLGHAAGLFAVNSGAEKLGFQNGAVFIFFLLSGFLICYSTISKGQDENNTFRNYFIDRFCRIFVAFVPALMLTAVIDYYSLNFMRDMSVSLLPTLNDVAQELPERYSFASWVGNLFMVQSGPIAKVLGVISGSGSLLVEPFGSARPFWTISIEWWIYMSFGIIAFTWLRGKSMAWWQLILFAFVSLTPAYFLIGGPDQCLTLLWITGALAAFALVKTTSLHQLTNNRRTRFISLALAIGFGVAAIGRVVMLVHYESKLGIATEEAVRFQEFQFGIFLAGVVFSLLIYFGTVNELDNWLVKIIKYVAGYSYSLYLTHMQVLLLLYLAFPGHENDIKFYVFACVAANIVAMLFWWLFERHYHKIARFLKATAIGAPRPMQRPA